jgi:GNAT superfamily N-acetyltransferase
MGRLQAILAIRRSLGIGGVLRAIGRSLYSRREMVLLSKTWRQEPAAAAPEGVEFREASIEDVALIAEAWPDEFASMARQSDRLGVFLRERFEEGVPCFIAMSGDALLAAMWCKPWTLDRVLPVDLRGRNAYEVLNLFTVAAARGKGLGEKLARYGMGQMADRGQTVAYSRILPARIASLRLHEKMGFQQLGMLVMRTMLGRFRGWVKPAKKA